MKQKSGQYSGWKEPVRCVQKFSHACDTCDTVDRFVFRDIHQFNGEYGCALCLQPGDMLGKGRGNKRSYGVACSMSLLSIKKCNSVAPLHGWIEENLHGLSPLPPKRNSCTNWTKCTTKFGMFAVVILHMIKLTFLRLSINIQYTFVDGNGYTGVYLHIFK